VLGRLQPAANTRPELRFCSPQTVLGTKTAVLGQGMAVSMARVLLALTLCPGKGSQAWALLLRPGTGDSVLAADEASGSASVTGQSHASRCHRFPGPWGQSSRFTRGIPDQLPPPNQPHPLLVPSTPQAGVSPGQSLAARRPAPAPTVR